MEHENTSTSRSSAGLMLPVLPSTPPQTRNRERRAPSPDDHKISHWSKRRTYHPGSLPQHMAVTVLDLDTTKNCNLRCGYCFKSETVFPGASRMNLDTAMTAIDWLIAASYGAVELWVNLFGGEPLLQFPLIKQLVPYAKRRCAAHGKAIQFGCTTNLTLINDEIAEFFRQWGMGWHCSIDGSPEVQNKQRPGVGGTPSSERAERGIEYVLKDRPGAMARATLTPALVGTMYKSVLYFEQQGFHSMGFAIADENDWTDDDLREYDRQLSMIREHVRDNWYRKDVDREFGAFDHIIRSVLSGEQQVQQCGVGRGMVLIDEHGDIWPCHRFDGADFDSNSGGAWRFGNMFEDGFNHLMHLAFLDKDRWAAYKPGCAECPVHTVCAGGCAAANLVNTGSIYYQDYTNCEASRIAYRHAMALHDELKAENNPLFMRKFHSDQYQGLNSYSAAPQPSESEPVAA